MGPSLPMVVQTRSSPRASREPSGDEYSHEACMARYKEQVPHNIDFTAPNNESLFGIPKLFHPLLKGMIADERDWVCLELLFNAICVVVPAMIGIFFLPMILPKERVWACHIISPVVIVAIVIVFMARYVLTLHVTSPRRLFKKQYNWMNSLNEIFLCPFFGIPSGFYYLHHVIMHHIENNVFPYDVSSTMPFQRDTWSALFQYISRYWTHAFVYLPYYALKKKRYRLAAYCIFTSVVYFGTIKLLWNFNWLGTVWAVLVPMGLTSMLLMQGNYTQHIFIDPKQPFANYSLAFNVLSGAFNQMCYNDGYHIVHRIHSTLHWTEVPKWFEDHIEEFARNDSLCFQGVDNNYVWYCVFFNKYEALYKTWVQLTPKRRSLEEFKELIKERLVPQHGEPKKK